MSIKQDIADIAIQAVHSRRNGKKSIVINNIKFNLIEKGYCQRFVRQCYEAGLKIPEFSWRYRAANAYDGENAIKEGISHKDKGLSKVNLENAEPGDIFYFNSAGKPPGHTAIYIGNNKIAENTSANRGDPYSAGTKITHLDGNNLQNRITGIYSMFSPPPLSGYEEGPVDIFVNKECIVPAWMTGGDAHIIVGLRNLCNAINYNLEYDKEKRIATIKPK